MTMIMPMSPGLCAIVNQLSQSRVLPILVTDD